MMFGGGGKREQAHTFGDQYKEKNTTTKIRKNENSMKLSHLVAEETVIEYQTSSCFKLAQMTSRAKMS